MKFKPKDRIVKKNNEKILVVDDEEPTLKNLEHILLKEGYDVVTTGDGQQALNIIESSDFSLLITDFKMKGVDGMQLLKASVEKHPLTEVIMITGYATVDLAVSAMKEGAYSYIAKPFKIDHIRKIVREALLKRRLRIENFNLRTALDQKETLPALIGKSRAMIQVKETIHQIASSNANVLILGESGTGKELAARSVHILSHRKDSPFVAFNSGAFTEDLMANELFGHEKEAFTGAASSRPGLLESAEGGTVFLDEIGDMPFSMQVKLLRAVQEKDIQRVGGLTPIPINVRFISATHRDLSKDIESGQFRQDLFYRLNVITLQLPSLAERAEDIPLLAIHFLKKKGMEAHKDSLDIDKEVMEILSRHSWPGNVRELENVIERAVALCMGSVIRKSDLPDYLNTLSIETYRQANAEIPTLYELEKRYIEWVLEKYQGNKTHAAQVMGIDRVSLWRKIKRYNLE
ncbi:MAG: sigma-54-dependent Fis family transcriptional regulator [Desulfobacteraceae bacterium]|nr:sigma-54-dependent Fis family transcriptional regulator [Desulfobacteraceae bacterium]